MFSKNPFNFDREVDIFVDGLYGDQEKVLVKRAIKSAIYKSTFTGALGVGMTMLLHEVANRIVNK